LIYQENKLDLSRKILSSKWFIWGSDFIILD
jgi:hypothetical protein